MSKADIEYYEQIEDYEDFKDFLDLSPIEEGITEDQFPPFEPDFSSAIVVDNLPTVTKDKIPKFLGVLLKIYMQIAAITENDIHMPFDDAAGTTYGFAFIKFKSKDEAENAIKVTHGFAMDKKHQFNVTLYSDLAKYQAITEECPAPQAPNFNHRPDCTSWLSDHQCRDQLVSYWFL